MGRAHQPPYAPRNRCEEVGLNRPNPIEREYVSWALPMERSGPAGIHDGSQGKPARDGQLDALRSASRAWGRVRDALFSYTYTVFGDELPAWLRWKLLDYMLALALMWLARRCRAGGRCHSLVEWLGDH